jgi:RsiW-degrading membrane proteinase PrsW (M82 family)
MYLLLSPTSYAIPGLILGVILLIKLFKSKQSYKRFREFGAFFAFFSWALTSLFYEYNKDVSFFFMVLILIIFFLWISISEEKYEKYFKKYI